MTEATHAAPTIDLRLGDCLDVLATLADGSVDAVVTDPPYGTTRQEWDQSPDWPALWAELRRVATPNAAFVVFSTQPEATDVIVANRAAFRYDLVWSKNIHTGFLNANRCPLRSHELVLVFGHKFTYNRIDWPRRKFTNQVGRINRRKAEVSHVYDVRRPSQCTYGPEECPKSVLDFPRPGNTNAKTRAVYHPNGKPINLMNWLVASYTAPGSLVLDPFMGSGSTGVACLQLGRSFLGIDSDPAYHAMARARLDAELAQPALPFPCHGDDLPRSGPPRECLNAP